MYVIAHMYNVRVPLLNDVECPHVMYNVSAPMLCIM